MTENPKSKLIEHPVIHLLILLSPTIAYASFVNVAVDMGYGGFSLGKLTVYSTMFAWIFGQIFALIFMSKRHQEELRSLK